MILLLIVLLILVTAVRATFFMEHISPLRESLQQANHHPNDRSKFSLCACHLFGNGKLSRDQDIKACRALKR
jgi:hypothetical protein